MLVFVGSLTAFAWMLAVVRGRMRQGRPLVEARPHPQVPWDLGDVVIILCFYFAVASLLPLVVPLPWSVLDRVVSGAFVSVVSMLAGIAWLQVRGADAAALGFASPGRATTIGLALGGVSLVLFPLLMLAAGLNTIVPYEHPILEFLETARGPEAAVVVILSAVVIAPLAEEFFFRRVLQGWLEKRCAGDTAVAVAGSALAFAAAHQGQGLAYLPLFPLGLVLGVIVERTGSILPAILLHAAFNAVSVFMMLARPLPMPGPAG
jgi:membrane protease YdiL (CAAX protease family)